MTRRSISAAQSVTTGRSLYSHILDGKRFPVRHAQVNSAAALAPIRTLLLLLSFPLSLQIVKSSCFEKSKQELTPNVLSSTILLAFFSASFLVGPSFLPLPILF